MITKLKNLAILLLTVIQFSIAYAQKDLTRFLGIPVDGFRPEMVQKLKAKGFTVSSKNKDMLEGEFNGTNVHIVIVTNNNKVWRIGVADDYSTDERNIKTRFNNLIQQFKNNEKYMTVTDSTIAKYTIPEDEDISYGISVKNKSYEAAFYQKTEKYDNLAKEKELLLSKDKLTEKEKERLSSLIIEVFKEFLASFNKTVWFKITEDYGRYRITLLYDNIYNQANGEGL